MSHEEDSMKCVHAVIGGGIAGVTCAEHLYILDPDVSIILITPTSLIKAVTNVLSLTRTLDTFNVEEKPASNLQCQCPSVTIVQGFVSKLDCNAKTIHTECGKKIIYDKVCICTGAIPKVISENNPFVISIRDTESVLQFQERINNATRILIVGNGGIATEMVYEITGIEVIWAVKDNSMNATFIDPGAAEFLKTALTSPKPNSNTPAKRMKYTVDENSHKNKQNKKGEVLLGGALGPDWHTGLKLSGDLHHHITLQTEVEVKEIMLPEKLIQSHKIPDKLREDEGEWPVYVELTNGKVYGCNFIVSATGVTPNTSSLLDGNTFAVGDDGSLIVDENMMTSEQDVFAAGDVCSPGWEISKHWFQMRLWTQARQMGSYAAKSMWSSISGEAIYMDFCFELFSHATNFFGYKVILLGLFNGQTLSKKYEIYLRVTKGKEYVKCVMVDGKMQGALLIGETDLEETFENLILNQMDLSVYGEDLLSPDVDIEDYFD